MKICPAVVDVAHVETEHESLQRFDFFAMPVELSEGGRLGAAHPSGGYISQLRYLHQLHRLTSRHQTIAQDIKRSLYYHLVLFDTTPLLP